MNMHYLDSARRQFQMYKNLGERAMEQVTDEGLNWQANDDSNSITVIVKHLSGNMLSRWTDFLTTDGEKPWRQRDAEFEAEVLSRDVLMKKWEEGWQCLFKALNSVTDADLDRVIYIRNEGDTLLSSVNRQISHYAYHVGQIVFIAKMLSGNSWESLSVPRNKSAEFNNAKFSREKTIKHTANELVKP